MKTYIKPQTVITTIATTKMVCASVSVDNTQQDDVVGTAKERDVWANGFWD